MLFRYLGDGVAPYGAETVVFGKYPVVVGGEVDLPDALTDRALCHPHFVEVKSFAQSVRDDVSEFVNPGSSDTVELSKADLVAEAEVLGVDIDKRWSAAKIGNAIDAFIKAKRDEEQG